MDQSRPDLQRGALKGSPRSLLANLANLWQSPAARLSFLGVVALAFTALQLAAVWPDEHHWAKLSPSFAELEGRGEVPWDDIPAYLYDEYILKYDLWHAKEKFCYDDSTEKTGTARGGYETSYTKQKSICKGVYTTVIEGRDGGESCRGRGKQCEDHFAATNTARATTCVALTDPEPDTVCRA